MGADERSYGVVGENLGGEEEWSGGKRRRGLVGEFERDGC